MGFEEYTYEFDAAFAGDFSFFVLWPDCVDYSICGYLDERSVFVYRKGGISEGGDSPRRAPSTKPDTVPPSDLYQGTVAAGHHRFRVVRLADRKPQSSSNGNQASLFLDGRGTISYPVYHLEQQADNQGTWYEGFETSNSKTKGFQSDKGWCGRKEFTRTIPSDVPYTIDWM